MNAKPYLILKRLEDLGITCQTHTHAPVFTVEEAQAHCSHLPGGHCKNLFLKDKKGALWLVVTLNERPIDMKELRHKIGSHHLSFGKPDLLRNVLGVEPGSVTPFALINDNEHQVRVVLDKKMMAMDLLNYHPLINTMTTAIGPEDLLSFIHDTGHKPNLVDL
jgi:Ala-tRNA(Pro) deacylase